MNCNFLQAGVRTRHEHKKVFLTFMAAASFLLLPVTRARAGYDAANSSPDLSPQTSEFPRMSFIQDNDIRLGVDLNLGGAITYLAPITNLALNVINSHDWGREIQLSYYSGPVPYHPPGTTLAKGWEHLGWNPIQAGDDFGFTSRVLQYTNTGRTLYIRLVPMQWPLKNVPGKCECEVWLKLDGPVLQARCRLTNERGDHAQYPARPQELPAVYVNGPYWRLLTYCGDKPFTTGALSQIFARLDVDGHWASWTATENWAALVNDSGWGVGVWNPGTAAFSGGFYGLHGASGARDDPTGYIAPNRTEVLDHNVVYDYRYDVILGTVKQIRAYVYSQTARLPSLAFDFERDRQGWYYANATDGGWPITGALEIHPGNLRAQVLSPIFARRAEAIPWLSLEAAFTSDQTNATVSWRSLAQNGFPAAQAQSFRVVPDGRFHRYTVNLAASPTYRGLIIQMRLDVFSATNPPCDFRLKSVTLGSAALFAQMPPQNGKFEPAIRAFEKYDKIQPPPQDAVLFYGSSAIRKWTTLARDFPGVTVIDRGFGGARIADCTTYASRIVIPYHPRMIVFYDGENDLAAGESVDNVVADYTHFVAAIHAQLPQTPVLFISLKPSPIRWNRWKNEIMEVNRRIALIKGPELEYVDVFSHMVDANGNPRADLFLPDRLHPNQKGYAVWASLIRPYLPTGF